MPRVEPGCPTPTSLSSAKSIAAAGRGPLSQALSRDSMVEACCIQTNKCYRCLRTSCGCKLRFRLGLSMLELLLLLLLLLVTFLLFPTSCRNCNCNCCTSTVM